MIRLSSICHSGKHCGKPSLWDQQSALQSGCCEPLWWRVSLLDKICLLLLQFQVQQRYTTLFCVAVALDCVPCAAGAGRLLQRGCCAWERCAAAELPAHSQSGAGLPSSSPAGSTASTEFPQSPI